MDPAAVTAAYKRWAPIYDRTFGRIAQSGRRAAIAHVNQGSGRVLEVGVGTGIALPLYAPHLEVTGVDFSKEMLDRARSRVNKERLRHVAELGQMDARALQFPNDRFETVVAMYLVSVVPEPERVVAEMARVCIPGGQVVIVNHFAREKGLLARLERALAPFSSTLGWHPDFRIETVLGARSLRLEERRSLPPAGLFSLLRLVKTGPDSRSKSP